MCSTVLTFSVALLKHYLPNDEYLLTYMFFLFLADNEAPIVMCPSDNTTNVDASVAGAIVFWSVSPNATDVVDATVNADSVVCEDHLGNVVTSGELFPDGVTTVTCRANDTSLNEGSCEFFINVTGKYLSELIIMYFDLFVQKLD